MSMQIMRIFYICDEILKQADVRDHSQAKLRRHKS